MTMPIIPGARLGSQGQTWVAYDRPCTHFAEAREVTPSADGCEACLAIGDTWVHLRLCLICGNVGCCNASKNRHAMRHFLDTGHPLMRSFEPDDEWGWCYVDETFLGPEP